MICYCKADSMVTAEKQTRVHLGLLLCEQRWGSTENVQDISGVAGCRPLISQRVLIGPLCCRHAIGEKHMTYDRSAWYTTFYAGHLSWFVFLTEVLWLDHHTYQHVVYDMNYGVKDWYWRLVTRTASCVRYCGSEHSLLFPWQCDVSHDAFLAFKFRVSQWRPLWEHMILYVLSWMVWVWLLSS